MCQFQQYLKNPLEVAQLVKNAPAVQETGLTPGLGKSTGEGIGYTFQYSGLENSGHGVAKIQTQLTDFHFYCRSKNAS